MLNLSPTQLIIAVIVIFLAYGIFQVYTLKDKVHCTFIRKDRTTLTKLAKVNQGRVIFDNGYYYIDIKRTTLKMVWMGFIPTWIRCLIFWSGSSKPLDPANNWNASYDDPQERKALNRNESIMSLMNKQNTVIAGKAAKKGMLESLMPIIMIGGFLIVGYLVYQMKQNQDLLGAQSNVLQQQLLDLMKALGK
jgi:hypothetical protein